MTEEFKRKVNELSLMEAQAQYMEKQLESINANINEIEIAKSAIEELRKTKEEVLVPIGAGVSIRMKTVDTEKILVRVGAGVVVEKDVEDWMKEIDKKKEELIKIAEKIQLELERFAEIFREKQAEVRALAEKQR